MDFEAYRGQTYYYAGSSRIAMKTDQGKYIWLYGEHLGSASLTADRHGDELSRTNFTPGLALSIPTVIYSINKHDSRP